MATIRREDHSEVRGTAMRISKTTAFASFATVAALVLAGCSSTEGGEGEEAPPADSGTVAWWGWTPDTAVAEKYIAQFNEEYPDIEVTYKNFENVDFRNAIGPALDSGEGPDVFNVGAGGGGADTYGPYTVDLSGLAEETLGADWSSAIAGGYANQLTASDGTLTAAPMGGQAAGMVWYNKNIFDEAGASVPTTYDEWVATCDAIEAIGKKCFTMGAGGADTFPTEMYHSIANSVDPEFFIKAATGQAQWDDPEGIEVLTIIKQMKDDGIIADNVLDNTQYPLANEEFMSEQAAMVQMGFWYTQYSGAESCLSSMTSAGVTDPTCFVQMPMLFPDVAGKGNGSVPFGEVDYGLAINADSENIAAAKTFVRWMTMSETGQQNVVNALDLLPALQGVTPKWADITLVDEDVQLPAIEQLIADSTATTQSRQWQTTTATLDAMVVAVQQVLDPTVTTSIEDIAAAFQASSEASAVGIG
jgi:ABC-type glycerol-3-phosphate transport system substrate-binding protein